MSKSSAHRYLVALTICSLFSIAFASSSPADTLVMPRQLVDFALANRCTPLNDFFERPGQVNPPYVYGWLPGDAENSAVFWCKKTETSDKPYKLMFDVLDPKQMGGCPVAIEWAYPRGLSIETRHNLALRGFRYVSDSRRTGPMVTVANAKVIVNEYDGLLDIFYCHSGQWLVTSLE
jgi:hypothetical protein